MLSTRQKSLQQELDDIGQVRELQLDRYDSTPSAGRDGLYGLELNDGLTEEEMKIAPMYALFRNGLLIVTGDCGSGKGVFSNHLSWRTRRFFRNRKVLLDYLPKPTFDYGFEPNPFFLFNWEFLQSQISSMAVQSGTVKLQTNIKTIDEKEKLSGDAKEAYALAVEQWRKKNEVLMQNCVMVLDEFKRYVHNRQPTSKINITFGNIISVWRHLNMLILGMCPNIDEIDYNSAKFYMTHHVKCSWMQERKDTTRAKFYRKKSVSANGIVNVEKKPFVINVNGSKPRPEIEVELVRPDLAFGIPERRITDYMKSLPDTVRDGRKCKVSNLNRIAIATGEDLNECNVRLLSMHGKWAENDFGQEEFNNIVKCKGYFDVYNSQNFANLVVSKNSMCA